MKKIVLIGFALLLAVSSCMVEWIEEWELVYTNDTDHSVQIKQYRDGKLITNISLPKGETATCWTKEEAGNSYLLVGWADSLFVVYDDSIIVQHYPIREYMIENNPYHLKRQVSHTSSYEITIIEVIKKPFKKPEKHKYRAEYTFTEEDYQEALLVQDK